MQVNINWYVNETDIGKKVPKQLRTVGITDDKKIYVPVGLSGNPEMTFMCLTWDGESYITYEDHAYVSIEWMMKEQPATKELCEKIKLFVENALKNEEISES